MIEKGSTVDVYQKPLSQEDYEGSGVVERIDETHTVNRFNEPALLYCAVRFDEGTYWRWVLDTD